MIPPVRSRRFLHFRTVLRNLGHLKEATLPVLIVLREQYALHLLVLYELSPVVHSFDLNPERVGLPADVPHDQGVFILGLPLLEGVLVEYADAAVDLVYLAQVVDLLVADHGEERAEHEDQTGGHGLHRSFLDDEKGHHAHLVEDHKQQGRIRNCRDEPAARVDLPSEVGQQLKTVHQVAQTHEQAGCERDEGDGRAEDEGNAEDSHHLGVEETVLKTEVLFASPLG